MRASRLLTLCLAWTLLGLVTPPVHSQSSPPAPNTVPGPSDETLEGTDRAPQTPNEAADELEWTPRNYRIRLTEDGLILGTISAAGAESGTTTALTDLSIWLSHHGEAIAQVKSDDQGRFQIAGVSPGVYSLVASSQHGYLAFGLQVLPHRKEAADPPGKEMIRRNGGEGARQFVAFEAAADSLQIDALAVPRRDFSMVSRLIRTYVPDGVLGGKLTELPDDDAPADDPNDAKDEKPEADDALPPSTPLRKHSVRIQPDGSVIGRTRRLHPETGRPTQLRRLNVFLVQKNAIAAQAPVNETGLFSFRSVEPGLYSFVAAGDDGFAAFSVEAVAVDQKTGHMRHDRTVPVAIPIDELLDLDGSLVPVGDVAFAFERFEIRWGQDFVLPLGDNTSVGGGKSSNGTVTGTNPSGSGALISSNPAMSRGSRSGGGGAPGGGGGRGRPGRNVPEIDPQSAGAALALLIGAVLLITDVRRRAVEP